MMTSTIRRSLCALALPLLVPLAVSAAPELPCLPDCEETPWEIPTQEEWITLPNGCVVAVGYAVRRLACGRYYDVGIKWLAPADANDPACQCLENMPISQLLDTLTDILLEQNPMGFPPTNPGDCNTNWRVAKGSCWSKQVKPGGYISYRPCSETACCLKPYTVCLDDCGNRSVREDSWPDYGTCPGATPPLYGGDCEPVCQ